MNHYTRHIYVDGRPFYTYAGIWAEKNGTSCGWSREMAPAGAATQFAIITVTHTLITDLEAQMKTFLWSVTVVVMTIALVGLGVQVQSGGGKLGKTPGKPKVVMPCPPGWHVVSGSYATGSYTCKPNKTKPFKCPGSSTYFEDECSVGCIGKPK